MRSSTVALWPSESRHIQWFHASQYVSWQSCLSDEASGPISVAKCNPCSCPQVRIFPFLLSVVPFSAADSSFDFTFSFWLL